MLTACTPTDSRTRTSAVGNGPVVRGERDCVVRRDFLPGISLGVGDQVDAVRGHKILGIKLEDFIEKHSALSIVYA